MDEQSPKYICNICGGIHSTAEHSASVSEQVKRNTEFFDADRELTQKREVSIREIKERLNGYLQPVGLNVNDFDILVTSDSEYKIGEFKPFYNLALIADRVFEQKESLRDAIILHEYFHGFIDPIGRPFLQKYPDVVYTVNNFLRNWRDGRTAWPVPTSHSEVVKEIWREYAGDVGVFTWDQTTIELARKILETFFVDVRANPLLIRKWLSDENIILKNDQECALYATLLCCALGEKMKQDWQFAAAREGAWNLEYEEGVCNYLASEATGVSMDELTVLQKQDETKIQATLFLKKRFSNQCKDVINKIKANASVVEFFH